MQAKIIDRSDVLNNMSEEELKAGYIKFNIPSCDDPTSLNGEGVWGWLEPEDKVKYSDDAFTGKVKAILCNTPIEYYGLLYYGAEVQLVCHGDKRPTLDPEWIEGFKKEA